MTDNSISPRSPLTANIYFPAIPTMANAFHVSIEAINITVTVYMVVQGLCACLANHMIRF